MLPGARFDKGEQVVGDLDPVQFRLLLEGECTGAILVQQFPHALL